MTESEGEIECLDEDAEIVQQCVRSLPTISVATKFPQFRQQPRPCLLVERPAPQKRKRIQKDDSEYEPSEDDLPPSPPSSPNFKKKPKYQIVKKNRHAFPDTSISYLKSNNSQMYQPTVVEEFAMRKKNDIRIPDYEDPLCLPVRAIKADNSDIKRLNNWNTVCLEHFKHCDTLLKPEEGVIKRSVRTAIFRNIVNKQSGKKETTLWSKTCVENKDADKKSEIFQSVLPRYREKKGLPNYLMLTNRQKSSRRTVTEVILSKENHKDGEALVVYKPQDSVSAVYGLIDKRKNPEGGELSTNSNAESKQFIKELAACRMCTPCFQTSWRGVTKQKNKSVVCPVCCRPCTTAYNLLSHFKSHSRPDVSQHKKIISKLLSEMVEYHYKCRLCSRRFDSIRNLRAHVKEHQGKEKFTCAICNRAVNPRCNL